MLGCGLPRLHGESDDGFCVLFDRLLCFAWLVWFLVSVFSVVGMGIVMVYSVF